MIPSAVLRLKCSELTFYAETNRAYLKGFEAHVSDALVGLEKNAEVEKAALLEMVTQTSTAASELSDGIRDGLSSLKSAKDGWSQAVLQFAPLLFQNILNHLCCH